MPCAVRYDGLRRHQAIILCAARLPNLGRSILVWLPYSVARPPYLVAAASSRRGRQTPPPSHAQTPGRQSIPIKKIVFPSWLMTMRCHPKQHYTR